MKNKKCICILVLVSLMISGCSVICPQLVPSLPEILQESSAEENLPSIKEIEVSEVSESTQGTEGDPAEEQTTLVPFGTADPEHPPDASGSGALPDLFLTEADHNYIYEAAYRTGDYSALDEKQMQVLSVAEQIVEQCQNVSDYEKALFVHDYLTATTSYGFSENPYSEYGALVEHVAVCQGYAYAFKLCMDLMKIPCITVGGTADNGEEVLSHAWNMIQLGGQWYHVDATWDDATTSVDYGSWCHLYFCVDDAFIAQNHSWTDLVQSIHGMKEIPAASDLSMFYFNRVRALQSSQEELEQSFAADFAAGARRGEYCCRGFEPDTAFIGNYGAGSLIYQKLGEYVLLYIDIQQ